LKACKKGFCFDLNHWMLNPKACSGLATGWHSFLVLVSFFILNLFLGIPCAFSV
jgi:hypothetical protein